MHAVRARFDGEKIVLPPDAPPAQPGDVIVIFEDSESADLLAAQEQTLKKAWDNDDDAVYDRL